MEERQSKLPPDGSMVEAMTYENLSDDLPPRRVRGKLSTVMTPLRRAKGLGPQCLVGPMQVDPATVRPVEDGE